MIRTLLAAAAPLGLLACEPAAPPPAAAPQGYAPGQNYGPQGYAPGQNYAPPGYGPQGYAPGQSYAPAGPPPTAPPSPGEALGARCVALINQYRATKGLPALVRDGARESCAAGEAAKDGVSGSAHGAFGACGEFAQNECPAWPNSLPESLDRCTADMWAEGPGEDYAAHGHYLNMVSTKYSHVFCGAATDSAGRLWIVQDFY